MKKLINIAVISTLFTVSSTQLFAKNYDYYFNNSAGTVSDFNKIYKIPQTMGFYSYKDLMDTKKDEPKNINYYTLDNKGHLIVDMDVSNHYHYTDTGLAHKNFTVNGSNGGSGLYFALWGKMTLGHYPVLGMIDIYQYKVHSSVWWGISSNADSASHDLYNGTSIRTANHYEYLIDSNKDNSHNKGQISIKNLNFIANTAEMKMPYIHLNSMPEGYYLTENQAKEKGFDFKAFNISGGYFQKNQMVVTQPNGKEFYFQTCMPQSNLNYNEESQELSCEYPSGLPPKIEGCSALYYYANGTASMFCHDSKNPSILNPNFAKNPSWYFTKNKLYQCKIGSLKADKNNGISCEIDKSVNQPKTEYHSDKTTNKIKLLPESIPFSRD